MKAIHCAICGDRIERKPDLYIGKSLLLGKTGTFHRNCWLNQADEDESEYKLWRAPYNGEEGKQTHWSDLAFVRKILIAGAIVLLILRFFLSGDYRLVLLDYVLLSTVFLIFYLFIAMFSNIRIARMRRRWVDEYEKHLPD